MAAEASRDCLGVSSAGLGPAVTTNIHPSPPPPPSLHHLPSSVADAGGVKQQVICLSLFPRHSNQ